MNRREFVGVAALGLASAGVVTAAPKTDYPDKLITPEGQGVCLLETPQADFAKFTFSSGEQCLGPIAWLPVKLHIPDEFLRLLPSEAGSLCFFIVDKPWIRWSFGGIRSVMEGVVVRPMAVHGGPLDFSVSDEECLQMMRVKTLDNLASCLVDCETSDLVRNMCVDEMLKLSRMQQKGI